MNLTPTESDINTPAAKPRTVAEATSTPTPPTTSITPAPALGVASVSLLNEKLASYLNESELKKVKEAYRFSDQAHLGQVRKSGEPYISHPIAVAEICADWKLDVQAIMAALLHDVMEVGDYQR